MEKDEFKIKRFRKELIKKGFFEDVILNKASVVLHTTDGGISSWIYYLKKYKKTEIKKFKDLFILLDEVEFPITITKMYGGSSSVRLSFEDKRGEEYYVINYHHLNYEELSKFIIGRRNSKIEPLIDRDFHYQISPDGDIKLYQSGVLKLNEDGTNTDLVVEFNYDYDANFTKVIRKSYKNDMQLVLEYPSKGNKIDERIKEFMLNIMDGSNVYYDVVPILKNMLEIMDNKDISINIEAKFGGEIHSEVKVEHNTVQRYTFTKRVSRERRCKTTDIFKKDLEDFLKR